VGGEKERINHQERLEKAWGLNFLGTLDPKVKKPLNTAPEPTGSTFVSINQ